MRRPSESAREAALRIAPKLSGVLSIQGPPGSGKTFIIEILQRSSLLRVHADVKGELAAVGQ
jgi:hypothetical protein